MLSDSISEGAIFLVRMLWMEMCFAHYKHAFHNLVVGSEMIYVDVNLKAVPPFPKSRSVPATSDYKAITIILDAHALCIMLYIFNLKL